MVYQLKLPTVSMAFLVLGKYLHNMNIIHIIMVFGGAFIGSVNMLRTPLLIPWQFGCFMHFAYNYGVQSLKQQMVFINAMLATKRTLHFTHSS